MGGIWDFPWFLEKNTGYVMGEIILKTGDDAIFSTTPAYFVLYIPIFPLNEKQIELDSMDEWNIIKGYGYQINLYEIFARKMKH